ncbi:MAG: hypothetical protein HRT62_21195 [Epibacterium sp.]|nr:hypothetical protein [Epibacterium sp.]
MSGLAIASVIGGLVGDWIDRKKEKDKAKHDAEINQINTTGMWEMKQVEGANASWKDEWFTIVLSSPLVTIAYAVAFDKPGAIERMREAFSVLETLPQWYIYLLGAAVLASFGYRTIKEFMAIRNG